MSPETKTKTERHKMKTAKITNCYDIKDALKGRAWKYNTGDKSWEKQGEWESVEAVETEVRTYAGVRNRKIGNIELMEA